MWKSEDIEISNKQTEEYLKKLIAYDLTGVGFVISKEENLALEPETRLQSLRASYGKSFIGEEGIENASNIDTRRGQSAPSLVFSKGAI